MKIFKYSEDDIRNPNIFNKKSLKKKYHKLSKKAHPDKGGCCEEFDELHKHYLTLWKVFHPDPDYKKHEIRFINCCR